MCTHVLDRVTVVVGSSSAFASSSVVRVESADAMRRVAITEDVERVILDASNSAEQFLHVLTGLPPQIAGDVLLIRNDGGAFLSATARGGDRLLYSLAPDDVAFYFETHGLTRSEEKPLARIA